MANTNDSGQCFTCRRQINTFFCAGCSKNFCRTDLGNHFQELGKEFDQTVNLHDQLRQHLLEQKDNPSNRQLIEVINLWEKDSNEKIKQVANRCREKILQYTNESIFPIKIELDYLTNELRRVREENEFNEIDINHFKWRLNKLNKELHKPSNISIQEEKTSFLNNIIVIQKFGKDTKWKQTGITVAGGNGAGAKLNQLYCPHGVFIDDDDDDQTIYIADRENHRIVECKTHTTDKRIVAGQIGQGYHLYKPTDVIIDQENKYLIIADRDNRRIMRWSRGNQTNGEILISDIDCSRLTIDQNGSLYVSDWKKNEVRRWNRGDKQGTIVAGGNGQGTQLNQLNFPTFLFVDKDYSLYITDRDNHRVLKWKKDAKEGIIVAGGNDHGNSLKQLYQPQGMFVDQWGQIYVVDHHNHRVMRWSEGSLEGTIVVGGNGGGKQANQLYRPVGLAFDRERNLYVADLGNDRIQKFDIE